MTPLQIFGKDILSVHVNDQHTVLVNFDVSVAEKYGTFDLEEFAQFMMVATSHFEGRIYGREGDVDFAFGGRDPSFCGAPYVPK